MIEWSDQHLMIRDAVRKFVEAEIKPNLEELEHGDAPPYDVLRKMMSHLRHRSDGEDRVSRARSRERRRGKSKGDDAHKRVGWRRRNRPDADSRSSSSAATAPAW